MVIEGRTDNLDLKDLPIYYQGFRLGIKDLNSPLLLVFSLDFQLPAIPTGFMFIIFLDNYPNNFQLKIEKKLMKGFEVAKGGLRSFPSLFHNLKHNLQPPTQTCECPLFPKVAPPLHAGPGCAFFTLSLPRFVATIREPSFCSYWIAPSSLSS